MNHLDLISWTKVSPTGTYQVNFQSEIQHDQPNYEQWLHIKMLQMLKYTHILHLHVHIRMYILYIQTHTVLENQIQIQFVCWFDMSMFGNNLYRDTCPCFLVRTVRKKVVFHKRAFIFFSLFKRV